MASFEFTGKSVREAVVRACTELNVVEGNLEIEVLEESTRGFLGIVGQRDARVRVTIREPAQQASEITSPEQYTVAEFSSESDTELEKRTPTRSFLEEEQPGMSDSDEPQEQSPFMEEARAVLAGILERIPVDAEVKASMNGSAIYLDIKGDGSGLLIGKKGQTLDSLQFLLNKILNKNMVSGEKTEVIVDSENYRMRKRENLRETALRMSSKAKKTLKPVSFNPMPPSERRMIHLFLAEDSEVYTKSYGEGPLRRIIVYPRRGFGNKRRRR